MPIHRTQSAHTIGDIHERQTNEQIKTPIIMDKRQITPEKQVIDLNVVLFFYFEFY